ncbi:MAG: COX15/CtaA family protein [Deltaproteobacteria bacterium]
MKVSPVSPSAAERWFQRFAACLLGYLLLVIVFGAWVRITGSGAGCGEHWPSCQGELVPRTPSDATRIEYAHRLSSGLSGLAALALPIWAFCLFPAGHAARRWSVRTLLLVALEGAIGAALVKNRLVADDASLARAIVVALHLVNTLLLTASATLTVVAAGRGENPHTSSSEGRARAPLLVSVLIGLGLVAATGAVTALGDTLFPVPLPAGDHSAGAAALRPAADHFLVQLRLLHPLLACGLVVAALGLAKLLASVPSVRPWALLLGALAILQLVLGGVNILLRAPGWLQLAHLLVAQLLWISAVLAAQAFWRSGSPTLRSSLPRGSILRRDA